jgi:hypothetical protein
MQGSLRDRPPHQSADYPHHYPERYPRKQRSTDDEYGSVALGVDVAGHVRPFLP